MQTIPRPEYPRPQMVRENWRNLNGEWQFCLDQGQSGRERGLHEAASLPGSILVPFCPGEQAFRHRPHGLHLLCVVQAQPDPARGLDEAWPQNPAAHRRVRLRHAGLGEWSIRRRAHGRLHFLLLRHHRRPEARRKPNHHLRHGHAAHAGTALRQAEPRLPFLRLLLYAHHGHLADRLAGKRTRSLHRQAQVYAGH